MTPEDLKKRYTKPYGVEPILAKIIPNYQEFHDIDPTEMLDIKEHIKEMIDILFKTDETNSLIHLESFLQTLIHHMALGSEVQPKYLFALFYSLNRINEIKYNPNDECYSEAPGQSIITDFNN